MYIVDSWQKSLLHADEPPHQICSYTLLFLLFLYFLYIINPPLCTPTTRNHTCLFDGHMIYDSHVFLVSPTCTLLRSDQSQALAPHGQALRLGWTLCLLSCLLFIFNLPVFYLSWGPSSEKSHTITYTSFPQNWDSALTSHTVSHLSHVMLPCSPTVFTLHHTWRWSLAPRSHPQSPIGFIPRSLTP